MWCRSAILLSLVVALFIGTAVVTATVASTDDPGAQYEQNPSGESYGSLPTDRAAPVEEFPDLVAVTGEGGVEGYAYVTDLFGAQPEPSSPKEALSQNPATRYVPVYGADGETVLGRFLVSGVEDDGAPVDNDPRRP
jgi:hypothetical protein